MLKTSAPQSLLRLKCQKMNCWSGIFCNADYAFIKTLLFESLFITWSRKWPRNFAPKYYTNLHSSVVLVTFLMTHCGFSKPSIWTAAEVYFTETSWHIIMLIFYMSAFIVKAYCAVNFFKYAALQLLTKGRISSSHKCMAELINSFSLHWEQTQLCLFLCDEAYVS